MGADCSSCQNDPGHVNMSGGGGGGSGDAIQGGGVQGGAHNNVNSGVQADPQIIAQYEGVKREKKAATQLKDGAVYEGEWKGDLRDGWGQQTWPEGARYEGKWTFLWIISNNPPP